LVYKENEEKETVGKELGYRMQDSGCRIRDAVDVCWLRTPIF
jgi:hypothetical protein